MLFSFTTAIFKGHRDDWLGSAVFVLLIIHKSCQFFTDTTKTSLKTRPTSTRQEPFAYSGGAEEKGFRTWQQNLKQHFRVRSNR